MGFQWALSLPTLCIARGRMGPPLNQNNYVRFLPRTCMVWQHKRGSVDCRCCGTWIKHWRRNTGETLPPNCVKWGCVNPPTVGAHIVNASNLRGPKWIVPMCNGCNGNWQAGNGEPFEINKIRKARARQRQGRCERN